MSDQTLRRQLLALRAQAEAFIAGIDVAIEVIGPERSAVTDATCPHPEDMRQDASTLRTPGRFRCGLCGEMVNGDELVRR